MADIEKISAILLISHSKQLNCKGFYKNETRNTVSGFALCLFVTPF